MLKNCIELLGLALVGKTRRINKMFLATPSQDIFLLFPDLVWGIAQFSHQFDVNGITN
jgi:hypothetical protein